MHYSFNCQVIQSHLALRKLTDMQKETTVIGNIHNPKNPIDAPAFPPQAYARVKSAITAAKTVTRPTLGLRAEPADLGMELVVGWGEL